VATNLRLRNLDLIATALYRYDLRLFYIFRKSHMSSVPLTSRVQSARTTISFTIISCNKIMNVHIVYFSMLSINNAGMDQRIFETLRFNIQDSRLIHVARSSSSLVRTLAFHVYILYEVSP
jgi:hypothetical protein